MENPSGWEKQSRHISAISSPYFGTFAEHGERRRVHSNGREYCRNQWGCIRTRRYDFTTEYKRTKEQGSLQTVASRGVTLGPPPPPRHIMLCCETIWLKAVLEWADTPKTAISAQQALVWRWEQMCINQPDKHQIRGTTEEYLHQRWFGWG